MTPSSTVTDNTVHDVGDCRHIVVDGTGQEVDITGGPAAAQDCEQHSTLENQPVAIGGPRQPKEEPLENVGQQQFLSRSTAPTRHSLEVERRAPQLSLVGPNSFLQH